MKTITAILILHFSFLAAVYSQGEIDDEKKVFYRNEKTYAITLNSNGVGANYRYARHVDASRKTLYELGLDQVKHEKEIKISFSGSQQIGSSFVYGKQNAFASLYGGIGLQKELFYKEDKGGISIRHFYTFGPIIGLQKPVYYKVWSYKTDSTGTYKEEETVKFEPHLLSEIHRKAPFYEGLKELKIVPGAYGKVGFSFEFGKSDAVYNAIEAGFLLRVFIKKIPIMANEQNHWIFPTFFVSYRFGKVIDAQFIQKPDKVKDILID